MKITSLPVLTLLALAITTATATSQQRIDGTFPFETDPAKQYSLYIPSTYSPDVPNRLMLGFHPLNTNRWDSISWCDTLIVFAETNGVILACPDGGADGRVDDPIDQRFTDALYDSVTTWYNVDTPKTYAMGFSWGGRATYEWGLSRIDKINGLLPIGAAITGTAQVDSVIDNAAGLPVYIVHGSLDAPNTRFFPIRDALIAAGAIVEWNLMSGVGHTIDFPNRNAILTTAFTWIDSVNCAAPTAIGAQPTTAPVATRLVASPNPFSPSTTFSFRLATGGRARIDVYDIQGRKIATPLDAMHGAGAHVASWDGRTLDGARATSGVYFARLETPRAVETRKIVLRN